ncbi:hypothetical protein TNCV_652901 [Trichonephila clavipes]|nr:hypothetical protein TNCV_652901 [Trichonephila clavipes]
MIVQFRNEKVINHGSIPITIDCNVVAFIVFEEGFHQPIKCTKQSVFLDVTVSPNFPTTPKGGRLSLDNFNVHWPLLHSVSSEAPGLKSHDMPVTSPRP